MKDKIIDFSNGIFTYEQASLRIEPEMLKLEIQDGRGVAGSFLIVSCDEPGGGDTGRKAFRGIRCRGIRDPGGDHGSCERNTAAGRRTFAGRKGICRS